MQKNRKTDYLTEKKTQNSQFGIFLKCHYSLQIVMLFILFVLSVQFGKSQDETQKAYSYLKARNEVYLQIEIETTSRLDELHDLVAIDRVHGGQVYAYADTRQFRRFLLKNYQFRTLTPPAMQHGANMSRTLQDITNWDVYPTYEQYLELMQDFVNQYPDLCKLHQIGTSVQNRKIMAIKISDNVNTDEAEPEFFYTSTMDGDETVGYVLLLRLIDYLLSYYQTNSQVTKLVDNIEIWINPLANPDGTYYGGNHTVQEATRCNAWGCSCGNLNRTYPDPDDGLHPNGCTDYPPETHAMMDFMEERNFVMSANLHGGFEIVNFPWDTWDATIGRIHADDQWFRFVSRQYVDTAHTVNSDYMIEYENGITNGSDWYMISGGRQDYVTYFLHGRETTIELSYSKLPPANTLPQYWQYNYRSLLNYIEQSMYGIHGKITDAETGEPLMAKIEIPIHDKDNSFVYSEAENGSFYRLIAEGSYDLHISAENYQTKILENVEVINNQTTILPEIGLVPTPAKAYKANDEKQLKVYPNPATSSASLILQIPSLQTNEKLQLTIFNSAGIQILSKQNIAITRKNMKIPLHEAFLQPGIYIYHLKNSEISSKGKFCIK